MKKIILSMLLCFLVLGYASAETSESPTTKKITKVTYYKVSAFCKLIQMGKYEAVKSLIEAGENVNKKSNGLTPLMFAARHNKAKIAKLLIKNGAKLKIKSDRGKMTALDLAKRSKAYDAIKVLKAAL